MLNFFLFSQTNIAKINDALALHFFLHCYNSIFNLFTIYCWKSYFSISFILLQEPFQREGRIGEVVC